MSRMALVAEDDTGARAPDFAGLATLDFLKNVNVWD
jgi:hypothetical protein